MYKLSIPFDNCLLFEFKKQKDLALTFFRIQEYYESDNEEIRGVAFSLETFLEHHIDKNGNLDYFNFWDGFNLPGHIIDEWESKIGSTMTQREIEFIKVIRENLDTSRKYYVIGAIAKDKLTIKHEIAHALYFMNEEYRNSADEITERFEKNKTQYKKVVKYLKSLNYSDTVMQDEVQAYMATQSKTSLVEDFDVDLLKCLDFIKEYRELLEKYNKKSTT